MFTDVSSIIPRPVRDLFVGRVPDGLTLGWSLPSSHVNYQVQAKAVIRTTLAAAAVFAVYKLGLSAAVLGTLAALSSLPVTVIAISSIVLSKGLIAIISSVSTGALLTLAKGLALAGLGYVALEMHDGKVWTKENTLLGTSPYYGNPAILDYPVKAMKFVKEYTNDKIQLNGILLEPVINSIANKYADFRIDRVIAAAAAHIPTNE